MSGSCGARRSVRDHTAHSSSSARTPMLVWVVFLTAALIYLPYVITSHSIFGMHLTRHELLNMNMTSINLTPDLHRRRARVEPADGVHRPDLGRQRGVLRDRSDGGVRDRDQVAAAAVPGRGPLRGRRRRDRRRARGAAGAPHPRHLPAAGDARAAVHHELPLPQVPGEVLRDRRRDLQPADVLRLQARQRQAAGTTSCSASRRCRSSSSRTSCARATAARSSPSATTRSPLRRRGSTSPTSACSASRSRRSSSAPPAPCTSGTWARRRRTTSSSRSRSRSSR